MQPPLLGGRGHLLVRPNNSSPIVFTSIKRPLSPWYTHCGYILRTWWRKIKSEEEGDDRLWTSNVATVACFFLKDRVLFLLKIMLIYWRTSVSGQPPLSGHLPVPRGWPLRLNGSSAVLIFYLFHKFTVSIPWLTFPVALPFTWPYFFRFFF